MDEDTLNVLHSYFKEFPKWLAKHQLDSYNDFINNQIPLILLLLGVASYRNSLRTVFMKVEIL